MIQTGDQQDRCQREYQDFLQENAIQDKGGLWRLWLAAYERGMSAGVRVSPASRRVSDGYQ